MRLLADENLPKLLIDRLRLAGHDVLWAGTDFPATRDKNILDRAETEGRILLTLDRDFWQIALQRPDRMRNGGVILFRIHPATPDRVARLVSKTLETEGSWNGQIGLVTPEGIDVFPAGRK